MLLSSEETPNKTITRKNAHIQSCKKERTASIGLYAVLFKTTYTFTAQIKRVSSSQVLLIRCTRSSMCEHLYNCKMQLVKLHFFLKKKQNQKKRKTNTAYLEHLPGESLFSLKTTWPQLHLNKPQDYWISLHWKDETKVEMSGHNGQHQIWRKPNTTHHIRCLARWWRGLALHIWERCIH